MKTRQEAYEFAQNISYNRNESIDLNLYSKEIQIAFVQGYFDKNGIITHDKENSSHFIGSSILCSNFKILESIQSIFKGIIQNELKHENGYYRLVHHGVNCLDFLGTIYENPIKSSKKYKEFLTYSSMIPRLQSSFFDCQIPLFKWAKTRPDAQAPYKANPSDSGWDLTLLEKIKEVGDVEFYATGIKICPDYGWYFDAVPRSSISKTDYMLTNSIGIIDRSYVGEILVPLRRMKEKPRKLELPARYIQIIPRPIAHGVVVEVEDLDETFRGIGGFGSSGTK